LDSVDHLVTAERQQLRLRLASIPPVEQVPIRFADPI
jgi:hypothetical protein